LLVIFVFLANTSELSAVRKLTAKDAELPAGREGAEIAKEINWFWIHDA
jgi:hypothetical protein